MDLDSEKINQQLNFLKQELNHLDSKRNISIKEYISNREVQYFIERAFQRAVEACINIGNHIIARRNLGSPGSFSDVFKILGRNGVISPELSEKFVNIARFRNKLVHLYWEIDPEEVYKYLQNNTEDLNEFYNKIVEILD